MTLGICPPGPQLPRRKCWDLPVHEAMGALGNPDGQHLQVAALLAGGMAL